MKVQTPFNNRIPKSLRENLQWRAKIHKKVLDDPSYASAIVDACSRDPLFFISGFCYTHDPRKEPFSKLPFILYDYQEEGILEILRAINEYDLLIEKSRDMGVSWMNIAAIFWCWRWQSGKTYLFGSRNEDYIDKKGNPKALFYRFDYILNNIPIWMRPKDFNVNQHRSVGHVENPENESVLDGEATTGEFASGDRRTCIFLDEFSKVKVGTPIYTATRDVTKSRIINGTPYGINNAFYDLTRTDIKKLRFHWSQHPEKAKGLYTKQGDNFEYLDKEYWDKVEDKDARAAKLDALIAEKGVPLPDGKLRSEWYAYECARAISAREIAQELDINYEGSGAQYFNADLVDTAIKKHVRPPFVVGDLEYDLDTGDPIKFRHDEGGKLRLWINLTKDGKPSIEHDIIVGADISSGTGASNSTLCGWNKVTKEKVFEYANPRSRPEEHATFAKAICVWFGKPMIIWESTGVGSQFGGRLRDLGYHHVYLRKNDESISGKVSDIPGWPATEKGKRSVLGNYRDGVEGFHAINRSKRALEECLEYVYNQAGTPSHARSMNKDDPSGAKANHGDTVMADALAWKLISSRRHIVQTQKKEVPLGSLAWRREQKSNRDRKPLQELSKDWN